MLEVTVYTEESYDEEQEKFVGSNPVYVHLEHSLVSVSNWESVWEESFLNKNEKTQQQTVSYLAIMLLDENLPEAIFQKLVEKHIPEINEYITSKQSATTVPADPTAPQNREIVTAELIYYWMIELGIPMECQHWHLNRLLMLIRVINFKRNPKTNKMSTKDRRALNRARRQKLNTRG
jgi:hypothetical protein